MKHNITAFLILLFSSAVCANDNSQFKTGDRGYLMEAYEDAISNTKNSKTFKTGYCVGVLHRRLII